MQFIEETAIVSAVENTGDGDFVLLQTPAREGCGNCNSQSGCASFLSFFSYKPKNLIKANNSLSLKQGDSVVVEMASSKFLFATVLMYLLPLSLLFLFALIAKLFVGEIASIIAGLMGLFGGLILLKAITQMTSVTTLFEPKLLRKVINIDKA